MNRKKGPALAITGICALVFAGLALYLGFGLPGLEQGLKEIEAASAKIDGFIEKEAREKFVNPQAKKAFERKPEKAENKEEDFLYSYISPQGIEFLSKSENWDESLLTKLYEELLKNKHGEEFLSLSKVIVYPQEDETAAATHQSTSQVLEYGFSFPAVPQDFKINLQRTGGIISLYAGDINTTVESMASSLSHEYGHHFTRAYMLSPTLSDAELKNTQYARLRNFTEAEFDQRDLNRYLNYHHKYLVEIAAEDYVTLMGSPNSRQIGDFCDVRDSLNGETGAKKSMRNALVQENLLIPMASDVKGLAEYFYSFIQDPMPEFPEKKDFALDISSNSKSYDFTSGYKSFTSYEISWDKVYGDDAVYTLVSFKEEDYRGSLHPIKTVYPGEDALAYIGDSWYEAEGQVQYAWDELATGTRIFVVTAVLPNGSLAASKPYKYSF